MHRIAARNEHGAIFQIVDLLKKEGYDTTGETGPKARLLPMPVTILIQKPHERVSFWNNFVDPFRPFLHGLDFLNKNAGSLATQVKNLKNDPCPSNVCLALEEGPDARTYIQKVDNNVLNMWISSNMVWGLPIFAVVSMLHEFLANLLKCHLGSCWWSTMCLAVELKHLELWKPYSHNPYTSEVEGFPMISINLNRWRRELSTLLTEGGEGKSFVDPFFTSVAVPIIKANKLIQQNELDEAHAAVGGCQSKDWKRACQNFIKARKEQNEHNG